MQATKEYMQIIMRVMIGLVLSLSGCGEESGNNNIIKIGVSPDYPPFEFKKDGQLSGFDIDLARLIGRELGKEVKFAEMEFNSILASLNNDHIDAGISAITVTDERRKSFDFSDIYHFASLAAIYKKEHPINNKDDLMGKKVACQLGTTMEIWLKNNVTSARIITFDNNNQAIESLKSGYSQSVIIDADQAKSFALNNPELSYQIIAKADDGFVVALKKNSDLTKDINEALKKLIANGEVEKLEEKWLSGSKEPNESSFSKEDILFIGSGMLLSLELMFGGIIIGMVFGVIISVLRAKKIALIVINRFISIIRGTPLILQLSFFFFAFPGITGIKLSIATAGIITFGLNSSAYIAEILRSGIESLPKGQFEAAKTLQIKTIPMWRDIILPQVFRNVLPSLTSELITLLKETALISTIGGMDLMRRAQSVASEQFTYFLPLSVAAIYYYSLVLLIEYIGKKIEGKYAYNK